jgi:hypothetical protein
VLSIQLQIIKNVNSSILFISSLNNKLKLKMKKLLYPMLIAVLVLSSCGEATADSNDAKATLSACDCKKEANKLAEEMKLNDLEEDCKDYSKENYKDCD